MGDGISSLMFAWGFCIFGFCIFHVRVPRSVVSWHDRVGFGVWAVPYRELKTFPMEGCSLRSVGSNSKEDPFLVKIIVECCCIFIIYYCWQGSTPYIASGLDGMTSFVKNSRLVETKPLSPNPCSFVVESFFGSKSSVSSRPNGQSAKKHQAK